VVNLIYLYSKSAISIEVAEGGIGMAMNLQPCVVLVFQTLFCQLSVGCVKKFDMAHVSLDCIFAHR